MIKQLARLGATALCTLALLLAATRPSCGQAIVSNENNPFLDPKGHQPFEIGALVQGGLGVTENRNDFKFLMAGVHAGKVLTPNLGHGPSAATSSTPSKPSPSGSPTRQSSSAPSAPTRPAPPSSARRSTPLAAPSPEPPSPRSSFAGT
ncbi:hypothetical protein [Tunturiibacter gelidiferens]|uniref:hypothetical protein n=1 Tax=Tunturiibacter gelidiferens TaxID=3069689 RepID=UPI003D9AD555